MDKKQQGAGSAPVDGFDAEGEDEGFTVAPENIFADFHPSDEAEVLYFRVHMLTQFEVIIRYYGWTQEEAAEKFGVPLSSISELLQRKFEHFSFETMIRMAARVGIVMRPRLPAGMPDSLPDGWPQPAVPVRRPAAMKPAARRAAPRRSRAAVAA